MATSIFSQGQFFALETDRGSTPSGAQQYVGTGAYWWNGGRKIPLITDGLPSLKNAQGTIFPTGHAGLRQVNQQAPVVGRQWSEGDFSAPVVGDMLTGLLYAAMGSLSSNMVPAAAPSLLATEPVNTNPKSFVLTAQPDAGGNILRFEFKNQNATDFTIAISGVDAYGNGASEVITHSSPAGALGNLCYSRTSWSAIGASGIKVTGLSTASMTIIGIRNFVHTVSAASAPMTFSMERVGTPVGGNPASRSAVHPSLTIKELTLNSESADPEGIVMLKATVEGDPTAACVATSYVSASPLRIIPAWTLRLTRDGGTAWNQAKNLDLTITTGNHNIMAAAGSQAPQGTVGGGMELTGQAKIYFDNELEYNRWRGASALTLYARWYTDWKLTGTQNVEMGASLPFYVESADEGEDEDSFSLDVKFRSVSDSNWGIGQFQVINATPGKAFGNTVV